MGKATSVVSNLLLLAAVAQTSRAVESTWEYSVQVSVQVRPSPAQIALSWPQDSVVLPTSYVVYRKELADTAWGTGVTLPGTSTSYVDKNVQAGAAYEYQIVKNTSLYTGYGYIYAGIEAPLKENRGKLLLVVDNTYASKLAHELGRLEQDLVGDGWSVIRLNVTRANSVTEVKNLILGQYHADPADVKCVFLFGHAPVPYSGDIVPDGHVPGHRGAWPCDGYYGDMDGEWTDKSVNETGADDARNRNVPGDGKFDQSTFPAPLRLMVGRVDLANMPGRLTWGGPATFPSELELLRNYLNKDHEFRTKGFDLPRQGVVGDYFGARGGEAFAASGWRNFAPFFGASNITTLPNEATWIPTLSKTPYLWAYGCGAGSYTSIGGLGNMGQYHDGTTLEMYQNDVKTVFTMLYGSWLGDWDSEDNMMRCVLALPSYGLACAWSGRPHWFLQHMALGEPIGFDARLTQNNAANGLYQNQVDNCTSQIHIALMGDPTLRMHVVAPASKVTAVTNGGAVTLTWSDSGDKVLGYHVYRAGSLAGPFTRVTAASVTGTSFADTGAAGAANYMVRAVKLETSGSGTYYNLSEGAFLAPIGNAITLAGANAIVVNGSPIGAPQAVAPTGRNIPSDQTGRTDVPSRKTGKRPASVLRGAGQLLKQAKEAVETAAPNQCVANTWLKPGVNESLPESGRALSTGIDLDQALTPTGSATGTGAVPEVSRIDYLNLELPQVGDNTLHIISPTLLELNLINTKQPDPAQVAEWNFVDATGNFAAPPAGAFAVRVNGRSVGITAIGFKRRPFYASLAGYDLRVVNSIYLELANEIPDGQAVQVTNPDGSLWPSTMQFAAAADPLRYSPAIHVNQEGYLPSYSKKAMVGFYAGNLGELIPPTLSFSVVDANTGATAYRGTLVRRPDSGYSYSPTPYQQVYEADFTSFSTPGEYRLVIPGLGGSVPFLINEGVGMAFARAYALGLYHQRCGTATTLPYTRFDHAVCHAAPASVPTPAAQFPFTWNTVSNYALELNPDSPPQKAPALTGEGAQLFPFVNKGTIDVSGGHHDAGDYSKYTVNSAWLTHVLMFTADSLAGVAALDNLGIPETGDGIPDVLQEAKWEADFLAKMQDADGGFYFLVYPKNREYENNVTPDHGDPQVVWPKTSSATAASVAALAQCASSPLFKKYYPQVASQYLAKAQLGWNFLMNAINKHGKDGIYQKITHYGDTFTDQDELAWAACEMYLATGNTDYQKLLIAWFDPSDPATMRWSWWRMYGSYGNAIRSYAFAVRTGRLSANQVDATFLKKCRAQIKAAADDALSWNQQCAYGTSFPPQTKAVQGAGWYFSGDQAFDITVAYQLYPKPAYLSAILQNINYEGGCNPVNVTYVTGLGWKRQRTIVSQWAANAKWTLPPSGIPVGNIQGAFSWLSNYGSELGGLCFPGDGAVTPYPFYDRWTDNWNVTCEMVHTDIAHSLANASFIAAQTSLKAEAWKPVAGSISVPTAGWAVGSPVTVGLQVPGMDLSGARITWEAGGQEPTFGSTFTFTPQRKGTQWVEAEAQWPDGRRAFARGSFSAN